MIMLAAVVMALMIKLVMIVPGSLAVMSGRRWMEIEPSSFRLPLSLFATSVSADVNLRACFQVRPMRQS
ncbi:hypothetical protein D3C86_1426180 [compost metagenome]